METTIRQFIIGMLLLSGIITGCFTLIALSLPAEDTKFNYANQVLDKFNDTKTKAESIQNTVEKTKPSSGVLGILNGLVEVAISALSSIWDSFDILSTFVTSIPAAIGLDIPSWFTGMIVAIAAIIIAFSLMAAWFKWWL